jgi:phosphate transport system ATP-binding protein
MTETLPKISARNVNVFYGEKQAIDDVSIDIATEHVTASSARRAAASPPSCAR